MSVLYEPKTEPLQQTFVPLLPLEKVISVSQQTLLAAPEVIVLQDWVVPSADVITSRLAIAKTEVVWKGIVDQTWDVGGDSNEIEIVIEASLTLL